MVELIITEKPSSAKKIAEALADGKLLQKRNQQCSYFELTHHKKPIIVTSAVGHLYSLMERGKKGWTYPVFDITWVAAHRVRKNLQHVKIYIDTITELAKKATEFTIACDYDVEGEVIGLNVIRYACKQKDAQRMKFSTLTKPELVEAYAQKANHLDWGQAHAGETRHKLDWFYGINLSRALTSAVKAAGSFRVMSVGRVQGPALKLLVDREKEIAAFKPEPYWQIGLWGKYQQAAVEAWHLKDKIFDTKEVDVILAAVKGHKEATISKVTRTQREQAPPYPFDLTTLQTESYNLFKITPKETLEVAQSLYLAGATSYPRTSSQQLDPKLGFRKILTELEKQVDYKQLAGQLLKEKELKPHNGRKTDPAHPAIFPTGVIPTGLNQREQKLYDLIVKRFLATFAKAALRETMEVVLDVNRELFITKGTRTLAENWYLFYKPYVKVEEITLPNMKEGEKVLITEIKKIDKETQPPHRYNQSSIIKELEKRNLGTKATRADILDRLFQRGYLEGVQITVSKLGMETITILEKYAPTILDEELTVNFEEDLEKIREGTEKEEKVLQEAQKILVPLLADFKKKEQQIGADIMKSVQETRDVQNYIGGCPTCGQGKLMMRLGKFGRFIACNQYPQCTTTFKLPRGGMIKSTGKSCETCSYPLIDIIQKRGKQQVCINPSCKSKTTVEERKEIQQFATQKIEKKCPKCGKDLVVRRSVYGSFLGCSGYPQCRQIMKLETSASNGKKGEKGSEEKGEKSSEEKKAGKKENTTTNILKKEKKK